MLATLQLDG